MSNIKQRITNKEENKPDFHKSNCKCKGKEEYGSNNCRHPLDCGVMMGEACDCPPEKTIEEIWDSIAAFGEVIESRK